MNHLASHTQINTIDNVRVLDPNATVLRERKFLFKAGDQLNGVYRVNSGSVKLFRIVENGEQQIVGFYMPGDLIGLDALANGTTRYTAITMETSNISMIPFQSIFNREEDFDYQTFIHQLGASFNRDNDYSMMLSQRVERRLAWFLMEFSNKMAKRGFRADEFILPMKRTDIALFLGMAMETLSRGLTNLVKKGLIRIDHRNIELLDIDSLRKIVNCDNAAEENCDWTARFKGDMKGAMRHEPSRLSH